MSKNTFDTLTFKIGLSGTFWDKRPAFSIWLNEVMYASGTIDSTENVYLQFSAELEDDKQYQLKIRLENKTDNDTIVKDDGTIVKDMLLNINFIEIDGIELGTIKWHDGTFVPDDTNTRNTLTGCVNLGWNGAYIISFDTPYYLWLLEKL
jgi:hypothetical protein